MKETDLYQPIKDYFLNKGYTVQAEVKNCDIVCLFEDSLTVVEMKKTFNLKLLYQAIERKSIANVVFIAINRPKNFRKKEVKHMLTILKKMEIGVITVAIDSPLKTVEIIYSPEEKNTKKTRKRTTILNEMEKRNLDFNTGGSTKKDLILTAYREQSIFAVCILEKIEKGKIANIKQQFNIENISYILNKNHYGYFEKVERATYTLSEKGKEFLQEDTFKEAIEYYRNEVFKCLE